MDRILYNTYPRFFDFLNQNDINYNVREELLVKFFLNFRLNTLLPILKSRIWTKAALFHLSPQKVLASFHSSILICLQSQPCGSLVLHALVINTKSGLTKCLVVGMHLVWF